MVVRIVGGTPASRPSDDQLVFIMLEIIAVLLLIGWLLGMVSSYTLGGFIHVQLVVAIIMVLLRLIRGKRI